MSGWRENLKSWLPPEEIDFLDFGVPRSEVVLLDRMEASVYRVGGKVLKVYDGFMSHLINISVPRQYQQLTERTVQIIRNCPDVEEAFGYKIVISPIEKVGRLKGKTNACSVSEFVPGSNFSEESSRMSLAEKCEVIAKFSLLNIILREKLRDPHIRIDLSSAKLDGTGKCVVVTDVCGEIYRMNPNFIFEPAVLC